MQNKIRKDIKWFTAIFILMVMIISMMPSITLAGETGEEPIPVTINRYDGGESVVEIPEFVTSSCGFELEGGQEGRVVAIGNNAFGFKGLTGVTIPDSVNSIEMNAFIMNNLTKVTIPDSVNNIGESAFAFNFLDEVILPDGITSIERSVFQSNSLTEVTIPNSVTNIGNSAFMGNYLIDVDIPNNVKSIGDCAFQDNSLSSITIPDSVTSIGQSAFSWNDITEVTLGSNVALGKDAIDNDFNNAYEGYNFEKGSYKKFETGWKKLSTFPVTITGYNGTDKRLTIPKNITKDSNPEFDTSPEIAEIGETGEIVKIGDNAFASMEDIYSIKLGDNLEIGENVADGNNFKTAYENAGSAKGTYYKYSGWTTNVPPLGFTVKDYPTEPTNQDITVEVFVIHGEIDGPDSHTFTENGKVIFYATNHAEQRIGYEVEVTNIDKVSPEAPTLKVEDGQLMVVPGKDNADESPHILVRIDRQDWVGSVDELGLLHGEYFIQAKTVDNAGNESEIASTTINIANQQLQEIVDTLDKINIDNISKNKLDELQVLINDLPKGKEKEEANSKLNNLKALLNAIEAIEKYHHHKSDSSFREAELAIEVLEDSPSKTILLEQLTIADDVEDSTDKNNVEDSTDKEQGEEIEQDSEELLEKTIPTQSLEVSQEKEALAKQDISGEVVEGKENFDKTEENEKPKDETQAKVVDTQATNPLMYLIVGILIIAAGILFYFKRKGKKA
jgi:hypothetical protein